MPMHEAPSHCYIDSHCHLTDRQFAEDREEVLARASAAGVGRIVAIGDSLESSRLSIDLARKGPNLLATAGVHPHNTSDFTPETASALESLCQELRSEENSEAPILVALGEIGLDFYYDFSPRQKQIDAFLEQIEIARRLALPLVLHCRDAYKPMFDLLRSRDVGAIGGVMHCFSGTPEEALALVDMGLFIGIGGSLTFQKNEQGREAARAVPLESILLETDAPYLAPVPKRGRRNEPALLVHTAERLAQERQVAPEEIARVTSANAMRLFRLPH